MNCHEVHPLLVMYLDNETIPSERSLIQAHLARCAFCSQELASLATIRSQLTSAMRKHAAQVSPSLQALSQLQVRMADESLSPPKRLSRRLRSLAPASRHNRPNQTLKGATEMKIKLLQTFAATLLVICLVITAVPAARAKVADLFEAVFHFRLHGSELAVGVSGGPALTYQPFEPGYIPDVFINGPVSVSFGDTSEILFQAGSQFLIITQRETLAGETLPEGEPLSVNGLPAVLVTDLSGIYRQPTTGSLEASGRIKVDEVTPAENNVIDPAETPADKQPILIDYQDALRLTWISGNTRIDLLSNLSVEKLLKIAEGMLPTK